jgi:hypothetical protein
VSWSAAAVAFSLIVIVFVLYWTLWMTAISFPGAEAIDLDQPTAPTC